jgi:hypothetical protein
MKHKKNVVDSAKKRPNLWQVSRVKINYVFISDGSGIINLLVKPWNLVFCKKDDIGQKR